MRDRNRLLARRTIPCDRVPLFQKQLAQIGAVLTGDPGNQRDFVGILHLCQIFVRN